MSDILLAVGYGVAGGIIYGLTGFFKNKSQDEVLKDFDVKKFSVTVATSGVIGGLAGYSGIAPSEVEAGVYGTMIGIVVKNVVDAIWAKYFAQKK